MSRDAGVKQMIKTGVEGARRTQQTFQRIMWQSPSGRYPEIAEFLIQMHDSIQPSPDTVLKNIRQVRW